ncbi:hypothetical protein PEX1_063420 [Penicillium expansum]|nr:hypothetical protein PEXP_046740 [Penicillium expansum]KGO55957.1 hypothetical protein PEX1_063420 [Penicillium expansum]
MGHCKSECHKLERKNRGQQGHRTNELPSLPLGLSSSVPPSRRVEPSQNTIDSQPTLPSQTTKESAMNSWELVPNVIFPNLHNMICQLTSGLATDPDVYLQRLPYHSVITAHGGPQKIAQMLLDWIDPHIRTLEGRFIRTEDLLSVQACQNNLWSPNGGYVDIVTDSRNHEYWRAYPGQSKEPPNRIKIHNRAILRGSRSTLHYYVIAQGQGYRAANWLKLWEVPTDTQLSCTSRAVALNVLEMTMCRAFQSLPGSILEAYYGPKEDGKSYSDLGLNIIPLVLQGLSLGPSVRKSFSLSLEKSPDPDINGWPQFRYEYGKKAEKFNINFQRPLMRSSEFHARFRDAIQHPQLSQSFRGSESLPHSALSNFELLNQLKEDIEPIGLPWIPPNGNFDALVGFALEDFLDAESEHSSNTKISMPCQFQDSGWNMTNSLTWAANPIQRDLTKMMQSMRSSQERETESIIRFNQSIIQHSGLRVVLMCGRAVQDLVLPTEREETRLKLEAGEFPMFLEVENEAIKRVYVLIPNQIDAFLLREWRKTHKISEVLHFTSAITMTIGIRPYAGDNGCVLTKAIRDYMDERKGIQEPLMLETLHPMTRLWLTRRGFAKDEDISLLQEKAGGSLSNAILVLLHVTPQHSLNSRTTSSMSSFRRSEKHHVPEFKIDKVQLEAVRDLCCQLSKKLPVDLDHPSYELIQDVKSREEDLEDDVGEADVLERGDLETSQIFVDKHGTFTIVAQTPVTPWENKKPRADASNRSFTIGDKTREELLRGRKFLGTRREKGIFVVTIHSSIQLFLRIEEPPRQVTVKAEIKPPGQRHPHVWAQETLATDPGSRLAFCVMYTRDDVKISSYATSNMVRDLYKANSFVHWMEGEGVADIVTRPRQFVVVSSLATTLPRGISQPGSFYTDDCATLIPAKEFNSGKKRKVDAV